MNQGYKIIILLNGKPCKIIWTSENFVKDINTSHFKK